MENVRRIFKERDLSAVSQQNLRVIFLDIGIQTHDADIILAKLGLVNDTDTVAVDALLAFLSGKDAQAISDNLGLPRGGNGPTSNTFHRTMGRSSSLKFIPGEEELVLRPGTEKTDEERNLVRGSLKANPNFPRLCPLNEEQIEALADVAWKDAVEAGVVIMAEGALDSALFWIVAHGTLEIVAHEPFEVVAKDGFSYLSRPALRTSNNRWDYAQDRTRHVRTVGPGCCFGDSSMMYDAPRWCTVTAMDECVVWTISHSNFKIVQQMHGDATHTDKSPEDERMISQALQVNANLQRLAPLNDEHINPLVKLAWCQEVAKDQILMKEGDLNADAFYIVSSGSFQFTGSDPAGVVQCGDVSYFTRAAHQGDALTSPVEGLSVHTRGRGHCFGEISMLYCAQRFSTVHALEDSTLWAIDRSSFLMVQMKAAEDELKDRVKHLDNLNISIIQTFSTSDKEKFAGVMEKLRLTKGETLQNQGEVSDGLFILCDGNVQSVSEDGQTQYSEADPSTRHVHYFGKEALLHAKKSMATVTVTSQTATCLILKRDDFQNVCDTILDAAASPAFCRYTTTMTKASTLAYKSEYDIKQMEALGLLGCSRFGPINLVQHQTTGQVFVMKKLNKGLVVQRGLRKSLIRERALWSEVSTPFIVQLLAAYNEPQTLSFLLEPALGGELGCCYERNGLYGSAKHTQYYVAGVALAFEHLHKSQIVYRNLKPENVLISHQGHPKLTDMCLAKRVVGYTFTTCGTPAYMAPEVIRGSGHDRAVDWWTLGVLSFELMVGTSPFQSDHPMGVYSSVMRGITQVLFPSKCDASAVVFIKSMLCQVAIDRLPMLRGGTQNIIDHEWFSGFDWAGMKTLNVEPPFKPAEPLPEDAARTYLANFTPDDIKRTRMRKPIHYSPRTTSFEPAWDSDFAMQEESLETFTWERAVTPVSPPSRGETGRLVSKSRA